MLKDVIARVIVLCFLLLYGAFVVAFLQWTARTWLRSRRKPQSKREADGTKEVLFTKKAAGGLSNGPSLPPHAASDSLTRPRF
jgi:hypothetical protein